MMDWEYKFTSITRDTESNLARLRNRLDNSYTTSAVNGPQVKHQTKILNNGTPANPVGTPQLEYIPLEQSPGVVMLLQERLDQQAKVIQNLALTVRDLKEEREESNGKILELRREQQNIMNRLAEKGVSIETERKLEQWRCDVAADMHSMHSQLQLYKNRGDNSNSLALTNELYDSRKMMREECESFRREIDAMKMRMVKLEMQVTSTEGNNRELHQEHEKMERKMRDVVDTHQMTSRDLNRTQESLSNDKHEIVELRTSFINLQDKFGEIKSRLSDTSSQRSYPRRKKPSTRTHHNRSLPVGAVSPATSELFDDLTAPRAISHTFHSSLPVKRPSLTVSDLDLGLTDSDDSDFIVPPPLEYSAKKDPDSDMEDYLLTDLLISSDISSTDEALNLDDLK